MKQLLIIFLMATVAHAEDQHHFWTKHTTSVEPRETLRRDLMLVYTGSSDRWIADWNNKLCDLWMAPSKTSDVVGYFQATLSVRPLGSSKKVCDIIDPVLSDYTDATKQRWHLQRNVTRLVGGSNELTFLGHTLFPLRTSVAHLRPGEAWIYGLHGWEELHTRVPDGGYFRPTTLDISRWAECAYKVGGFKLKFAPGPTHNPGLSEISIKKISMMLWSSEEPQGGEPGWYNATTRTLTNTVVKAIVAVQRKGDCNMDGKVNGLDFDYFMMAFHNKDAYEARFYGVPVEFNCDMNWDGVVNGLDVDLLIEAVLNNGAAGDYWESIGYE